MGLSVITLLEVEVDNLVETFQRSSGSRIISETRINHYKYNGSRNVFRSIFPCYLIAQCFSSEDWDDVCLKANNWVYYMN